MALTKLQVLIQHGMQEWRCGELCGWAKAAQLLGHTFCFRCCALLCLLARSLQLGCLRAHARTVVVWAQ